MPGSGARIRGGARARLRAAGGARSEFYLRVTAEDRPGVLSAVTGVLGKHGVSIESVIQRGRAGTEEQAVPILIVTHDATYAEMTAACAELDALPSVRKGTFLARMIPGPAAA
jgi:homoserine dehydrogenase